MHTSPLLRLILYFKAQFSIDLRILAIFRIIFGSLILFDLTLRLQELGAHYTDAGVLPRTALIEHSLQEGAFSAHLFGGGAAWVIFLFLIHMLSAIFFTLGFKTRYANLALWILIVSLHNRNPLILNGGDTVARMLLFWSLFLPLGSKYSIDKKQKALDLEQTFFGPGTVAILWQMASIYIFTALFKTAEPWQKTYTACQLALSNASFATEFGSWLTNFPNVLKWMTWATIWGEILLPFLLFIPSWKNWLRILAILGLVALHVGIDLTMQVGLFSSFCIVGLILFIPSMSVDRLGRKDSGIIHTPDQAYPKARVVWDGLVAEALCIFCTGYVLFMNLVSISYSAGKSSLPTVTKVPERLLRIDQNWNMFSPSPPLRHGYLLAKGTTSDQRKIQIPKGSEFHDETVWEFPTNKKLWRWRKYYNNMAKPRHSEYPIYYASYLCSQWNLNHRDKDRIVELELYSISQPLLEDDAQVTATLLAQCKCGRNNVAANPKNDDYH